MWGRFCVGRVVVRGGLLCGENQGWGGVGRDWEKCKIRTALYYAQHCTTCTPLHCMQRQQHQCSTPLPPFLTYAPTFSQKCVLRSKQRQPRHLHKNIIVNLHEKAGVVQTQYSFEKRVRFAGKGMVPLLCLVCVE